MFICKKLVSVLKEDRLFKSCVLYDSPLRFGGGGVLLQFTLACHFDSPTSDRSVRADRWKERSETQSELFSLWIK